MDRVRELMDEGFSVLNNLDTPVVRNILPERLIAMHMHNWILNIQRKCRVSYSEREQRELMKSEKNKPNRDINIYLHIYRDSR